MVFPLASFSFSRISQPEKLEQDSVSLTQVQTHFQLSTISSRFVLILSSSTRFWLSRNVFKIDCNELSILRYLVPWSLHIIAFTLMKIMKIFISLNARTNQQKKT